MTDPAALVLPEVGVVLIGGDEKPGLILVEGAEREARIEVKRLTQHGIVRTGSRTDVDVSHIQSHVDA